MFTDEYGITAFGAIMLMVLVLFLLITPLIAWGMAGNIQKCKQMDGTGVAHEWTMFTGCRVQRPNGMWTNIDTYYMLEHIGDLGGE